MGRLSNVVLLMAGGLAPWCVVVAAGDGDPPLDKMTRRFADDVAVLASDEMEGRGLGTAGLGRAADWIEKRLRAIGLRPAFGESYRQPFEVKTGVALEDGNAIEGVAEDDWVPLGMSSSGAFSGELAFVGYGIEAPPVGYRELEGIDLKRQGRAHAPLRAAGARPRLAVRRPPAEPLVVDALQGPPGPGARRGRGRVRDGAAAGRGGTACPPCATTGPRAPPASPSSRCAARPRRSGSPPPASTSSGSSRTWTATSVPRSRWSPACALSGRVALRPTFATAAERGRASCRGAGRSPQRRWSWARTTTTSATAVPARMRPERARHPQRRGRQRVGHGGRAARRRARARRRWPAPRRTAPWSSRCSRREEVGLAGSSRFVASPAAARPRARSP